LARNGLDARQSFLLLSNALDSINLTEGQFTTTLESKTNFFRAGEGPVMRAVSIPLHIGRTTMVWQTTIRNPDGKVAAIVTQTQIVIPRSAK